MTQAKATEHFHVREIRTFGYMDVPNSARAFATRKEAQEYEQQIQDAIGMSGISTLANVEISTCDKSTCKIVNSIADK